MESSGGGDAFASSTAPLTWHDFLERMRDPSAADFVKSIKSFIVSFTNRAPDPEKDSEAVQEFLARMEGAFRAHTLWAGSSEEELESAGEGLEKYVMTKLFTRVFASVPEDVNSDEELFEKMSLLQQFVQPENLDIKPNFQNETSWLLAQKELQKINMYKAPRDKLVCILNCCKVINNLLINASIASKDEPPGADEFLPVLIYVTMKANPPQLHSNLLYIQRYRRQSRLVSEAAYYFTNILSAESFIWNIDAQALSMDDMEFQKKMEAARAHLSGVSTVSDSQKADTNLDVIEKKLRSSKSTSDLEDSTSTKKNQVPVQTRDIDNDLETKEKEQTKRPSISDLEKKGAADLLNDDSLNRHFQEFRFLYARAGDLTIDDVESLLYSYKQLAVRYVSLSKGLGITHSAHLANVETSAVQMMEPEVQAEAKNDTHEETTKDISDEELMLALNESVSVNNANDSIAQPITERDVEGSVISMSDTTSE